MSDWEPESADSSVEYTADPARIGVCLRAFRLAVSLDRLLSTIPNRQGDRLRDRSRGESTTPLWLRVPTGCQIVNVEGSPCPIVTILCNPALEIRDHQRMYVMDVKFPRKVTHIWALVKVFTSHDVG